MQIKVAEMSTPYLRQWLYQSTLISCGAFTGGDLGTTVRGTGEIPKARTHTFISKVPQ